MKKASFFIKLSILVVVFVLMVLVVMGLFTTGQGRSAMLTNEEMAWQRTRLITLSVVAGILVIGVVSLGAVLIAKNIRVSRMKYQDDGFEEIND